MSSPDNILPIPDPPRTKSKSAKSSDVAKETSAPPAFASPEARAAAGKEIRAKVSRESHAGWHPHKGRPDPVEVLVESSKGRMQELLPIRYGRMLQSPFAFFRGAAAIMAEDLAHIPATGIRVQACGDCHLVNFGGFATPERRIIFDINDFDETLPAPWEWDLKRLAASFVIASANNGFKPKDARRATLACVEAYRERMLEISQMPALEAWYKSIDADEAMRASRSAATRKRLQKRLAKASVRSVDILFPKLAQMQSGRLSIKDEPPLIFHPQSEGGRELTAVVVRLLERYRDSLEESRRVLFDRYEVIDSAMKVVGVGSVGTRCGIALLMASSKDAIFLQVKEARESVLEPYAGKSVHSNRGQRVVTGQRIMQSASDIFLGWAEVPETGKHFYIRQLADAKLKPMVEIFDEVTMEDYGRLCGWALAHAHARSGEASMISGYLGSGDAFDEAVADFAEAYLLQNERDFKALKRAVSSGKLEARSES
jgi:uncharacterized protein (DUF2252 family)